MGMIAGTSYTVSHEMTRSFDAVAAAELLQGGTVRRVRPAPEKVESNNVSLLALPADTRLIEPTLLDGRWLRSDDENALVVNRSGWPSSRRRSATSSRCQGSGSGC